MFANRMQRPARKSYLAIAYGFVGSALAIGALAWLTQWAQTPLILGSFGASCVLVFGFPELPFSQPRNVILGHVLSSAIGLAVLSVLGAGILPMALATALAVAMMMVFNSVHPPAGSNPVIIFLTQPAWSFLGLPTAAGAVIIVFIALIFNNLGKDRHYPQFW